MIMPSLSGPGIVLRPLSVADAEALFTAHADPETHLYWSGPAHTSVEQTRRDVEATLAKQNAHIWVITEDNGQALGRVGVFVLRDGVGELGIIMRREATGRGLASKSLTLVCDYAFNTLALHRLTADIDPENSASLALFHRAGFEREGLLRGNWKTHLGIRDSVILGKLRD